MKIKRFLPAVAVLCIGMFILGGAQEEWAPTVVISEVAWMGTQANHYDEWMELYNTTDEDIDLSGWTLAWDTEGETPKVIQIPAPEEGEEEAQISIIPAHGFYLLERTDEETISDIEADLIYKGTLDNDGELLILKNEAGNLIDTANLAGGEWPAGSAAGGEPPYASMERIDPEAKDKSENWGTNDGQTRNGLDVEGDPINGTPGQPNSMWEE